MKVLLHNTRKTHGYITQRYKDDDQSQWGRAKYDSHLPQIPYPVVTKICTSDYNTVQYNKKFVCAHGQPRPNLRHWQSPGGRRRGEINRSKRKHGKSDITCQHTDSMVCAAK